MEIKKLSAPSSEDEIKKYWKYTDKVHISCVCITFNQKDYIRDTIDSFLAQETEYRFEIIIHDDVSTDGTRDILLEYKDKYPSIIKLVLQDENQYSKGRRITPIAVSYTSGEYIAICEGDDFWIDKNKLQKQCFFLESNKNYGFIFTNIHILNQYNGSVIVDHFDNKDIDRLVNLEYFLVNKEFTAPCTWFMRKELAIYPNIKTSDGSFCWFVNVLYNSKVYYMNDVTTIYRMLDESASHSKDEMKLYNRANSIFINQLFFADKFNFSKNNIKLINKNHLESIGFILLRNNMNSELLELFDKKDISIFGSKRLLFIYLCCKSNILNYIVNNFIKLYKCYIRR
ncbi:glycosyltransferase [Photobacterium phosphoreum]|uniref:glycosyltransferase n=1 Tax=Photobacterium phosphoreum TaxID=659 RepID=UPI001E41FFD4|nr:glycosyltransferase [Photobacterium phosphoreum]MCD9477029.1 glycosyltransferase [Photobacterium phosphoreum]MCD9508545.1 glycosyltransferase [Photobacterium phosphoreum]MCF2177797.1 glycosyltransferase [Photobacterium phosphoreum]